MLETATGTAEFFPRVAPVLVANVLTVTFVYDFAQIDRQEGSGVEEGRLVYLWLRRDALWALCLGRLPLKK